jgi:hypothetical protein
MNANEYVSRGHKRVEGWLEPEAAQLIATFGQWQNVGGNVGEIGVHHGKLFILLHLLRRPGERSVAVDLFELQELNVDRSGRGDRAVFEQNLRTFAGGTEGVTIASADSTTVKSDDLLNMAGGRFRLFSVDGGHTAAITESDLTIASESLVDGGLLILDDYFNQAWPGVSEGTNRFLSSSPTFIPFGSGHGKMYFTTSDYAAAYRAQMLECANAHGWRVTTQPFFDVPHVTVRTRGRRELLERNARAWVKTHPRVRRVVTMVR